MRSRLALLALALAAPTVAPRAQGSSAWNAAAIRENLAKQTEAGVFSTRNPSYPTTIRLEYRRAAEGLGAWLAFHRAVIERCRKRR
jgi:hypothetical protein